MSDTQSSEFDPTTLFAPTPGAGRKQKFKHDTIPSVAPSLGKTTPVEWAEAVLWAVENISVEDMTPAQAGTPMRFALWRFGQEDSKALVVNLVQKALQILGQIDEEDDKGIAVMEEKATKEIEDLLRAAIEEAMESGEPLPERAAFHD